MTNFAKTTTNTSMNTTADDSATNAVPDSAINAADTHATNATPNAVDIHATNAANAYADIHATNAATTTTLVQGIGFNDVKALGLPKTEHHTKALLRWHKMLERCTSHPIYADVTIVNEWLTFSNFARWFETAVTAYGSVEFEVDKDLVPLTRGLGLAIDRMKAPRVYGPDVCLPISKALNVMLARCTDSWSMREGRGLRVRERGDGTTVYEAKYGHQIIGTYSTSQEAAYALVLERQRQFMTQHHQELKRLHAAGLIGLKGDTLIDVKRRIVAAVCPHSAYSIMEDRTAPIPRTKRTVGKPASSSPLRSHWVVKVDHRTGNRVPVKRYDTAALAVEGLRELEESA